MSKTPSDEEPTTQPGPPVQAEELAWLMLKLNFWAQCMAARFGAPVLLVGSALREIKPRDVDIRIPIADYEFVTRYEVEIVQWQGADRGSIWIRDMAKLGRQALRHAKANIDLQVWPWSTYEWARPHRVLAGGEFLPHEGKSPE